jgi:hypothetical protein
MVPQKCSQKYYFVVFEFFLGCSALSQLALFLWLFKKLISLKVGVISYVKKLNQMMKI